MGGTKSRNQGTIECIRLVALHFGLGTAVDAGGIDDTHGVVTSVEEGCQRFPRGIGGLHTGMDGDGDAGRQPGGEGGKAVRGVGKGVMMQGSIREAERGIKGGFGEVNPQSRGMAGILSAQGTDDGVLGQTLLAHPGGIRIFHCLKRTPNGGGPNLIHGLSERRTFAGS